MGMSNPSRLVTPREMTPRELILEFVVAELGSTKNWHGFNFICSEYDVCHLYHWSSSLRHITKNITVEIRSSAIAGKIFPYVNVRVDGHAEKYTFFKARKIAKAAKKMVKKYNELVDLQSQEKAMKELSKS